MQRTFKYIGWPIETKNHKTTTTTTKIGKTQNRKTLPENRNTNPQTEMSIPNRKHTQKNTKLNRKLKQKLKIQTIAAKDENRNK